MFQRCQAHCVRKARIHLIGPFFINSKRASSTLIPLRDPNLASLQEFAVKRHKQYKRYTAAEDALLLANKHAPKNFEGLLPGRSYNACRNRLYTLEKNARGPWTPEEDQLLLTTMAAHNITVCTEEDRPIWKRMAATLDRRFRSVRERFRILRSQMRPARPWSRQELDKLLHMTNEMYSTNKAVDWKLLEKTFDRSYNAIRAKLEFLLTKGLWTAEEDRRLAELVGTHRDGNTVDWEEVARELGNRSTRSVQRRWAEYVDPTLRRGKFTAEDWELIDEHLKENKGAVKLMVLANLLHRRLGSVYELYRNQVVPANRGPFDSEEDKIIIQAMTSAFKSGQPPPIAETAKRLKRKPSAVKRRWQTYLQPGGEPGGTEFYRDVPLEKLPDLPNTSNHIILFKLRVIKELAQREIKRS
ncbi:hypothetical protein DFS34DRAFT_653182 [Phlyctochytrium arcticum]|nr:hypothetical protein DFS34DRAFT_653182 [Phlyctochytrium arcticum]